MRLAAEETVINLLQSNLNWDMTGQYPHKIGKSE